MKRILKHLSDGEGGDFSYEELTKFLGTRVRDEGKTTEIADLRPFHLQIRISIVKERMRVNARPSSSANRKTSRR